MYKKQKTYKDSVNKYFRKVYNSILQIFPPTTENDEYTTHANNK